MIRNVIFDLGGVVLGRAYAERGEELKAFKFLQGESFPDFWKNFDGGTFTQGQVAEEIAAMTGVGREEAYGQVTTIMHMFDEFPGTVELVRELKERGYKLYVLSNMPHEFYEYIKEFEVFRYFDGVVISSAEKMMKPDERFFELLLNRYGLKAEETLFVDDKVMNTSAASEMGFNVCLFSYPQGLDEVRKTLKEDEE